MPVVAILICLLAAAAATLWLAKRRGLPIRIPGEKGPLRVIDRISLTQGASVVLIECEGRRLILGVTAHQVAILNGSAGAFDTRQS